MTGREHRPSCDTALKHKPVVIEPRQFIAFEKPAQQMSDHDSSTASSSDEDEDFNEDSLGCESSWFGDWDSSDIWLEARLFLELAGVSSLMEVGIITSPLLTASYIGRRFSPVYLSAFTLANLTGNICTFSLMAGMFSASDTLSPQAFGRGDFPEVGRIAIRGFTAAIAMLIPINVVIFFYLEDVMIALGQDAEASMYASQWYKVFVLNLPFTILYNCIWKFLTAQHIMKPLILVSIVCSGIILPLSLEICTWAMGFLGSAVGYVLFQASQALFLLLYVYWKQPHKGSTWPGLSPEIVVGALQWDKMKEFLHLGIGGIVAQCEWFFWEAVGLIVGKLGVVTLSAHTIPNQTSMVICMVAFSFGVAVAIRMGISLPISVKRTQVVVMGAIAFSVTLFGLLSTGIYVYRDEIVGMFTTDDDVKELANAVWLKAALLITNIATFGVFAGVGTGLGKQWPLGVISFVFLWLFGLPMIYYRAIIQNQGLEAAWFWMNVLYLCMNISMIALFVTTDWHQIRKEMLLMDSENEDIESNDGSQLESAALANEKTQLLHI